MTEEKQQEEYLLWVDVETTGLRPGEAHLLQVAGIITDLDCHELAEPFNEVVRYERLSDIPLEECTDLTTFCNLYRKRKLSSMILEKDFKLGIKPPAVETLYAEANEYVREMHEHTHLWERLSAPEARPLGEVDEALFKYLTAVAPGKRQARLAGNSVRLDLNFLEEYCPKTYGQLHYRSIDVSALAYAFEREVGWFEKKKTHDALDDIRESLEEYRWLKARILAL